MPEDRNTVRPRNGEQGARKTGLAPERQRRCLSQVFRETIVDCGLKKQNREQGPGTWDSTATSRLSRRGAKKRDDRFSRSPRVNHANEWMLLAGPAATQQRQRSEYHHPDRGRFGNKVVTNDVEGLDVQGSDLQQFA